MLKLYVQKRKSNKQIKWSVNKSFKLNGFPLLLKNILQQKKEEETELANILNVYILDQHQSVYGLTDPLLPFKIGLIQLIYAWRANNYFQKKNI